jgi:choline kinase
MAGAGSRLRGADTAFLKPLVPVRGRPLVTYLIDTLRSAGIKRIHFVVGYQAERMAAAIKELIPLQLEALFIENRQWQKQNGISLITAAENVASPFLLTMSDHIFDPSIIEVLIESADLNFLNIAVDKKLDSIFDLEDAMKVETEGERVVSIGKTLRSYHAIDVGLFVCPREIFHYLEQAKQKGDCSLADGIQLMAQDKKVRAVDIAHAWWQDIDTPEMLIAAEKNLQMRTPREATTSKICRTAQG